MTRISGAVRHTLAQATVTVANTFVTDRTEGAAVAQHPQGTRLMQLARGEGSSALVVALSHGVDDGGQL